MIWLRMGAVAIAACIGATGAWKIQAGRIDAIKAENARVIAEISAAGQAAQAKADERARREAQEKEKADHEYQDTIARLRDDVQRLHSARARTNYVPPAAPAARNPDLACFDRGQLEQALRSFDAGASEIVGAGDEAAAGLNAVKEWAKQVAKEKGRL